MFIESAGKETRGACKTLLGGGLKLCKILAKKVVPQGSYLLGQVQSSRETRTSSVFSLYRRERFAESQAFFSVSLHDTLGQISL